MFLALALPVLLGSCGGGGLAEVVRTGGTGSPKALTVSSGVISGLGGIIVNGVRFDESGALVTINGAANRAVSELQLGMVVEVTGEIDSATQTGKASTIVATALLSGPAGAVDTANGEITVLGQRVEVKSGTVLQGASALSSVNPGEAVVVYGFWDYQAGHIDATRLELRPAVSAPSTVLIGKIGAVTGTRFQVGALTVESAGATVSNLPAGLAAGIYVEVRGLLDSAGILRASAVTGRSEFSPVEGALTELEGYVTDFTGAGQFKVLGAAVNGASARVTGLSGALANGALVEVEGQVVQGVIVATLIDVKAAAQQPPPPVTITVSGVISDFVSASSFRVLDQTVDASRATFSGGTAADLANGRAVEVTGIVNGNVLVAGTVAIVVPPAVEGTRLTVSGAVELFVSPTNFRVNGQAVITTAGTIYTGGNVADLANGRRVDVDGLLTNGVLTAWYITFQPVVTVSTVTLSGVITDFVSPSSFKVNNQAIATNAATVYEEGTAAGLANGRRVTIVGLLANGVVSATRVSFADSAPATEDAEVEGAIQAFVSVSNFTVKGQVIDASAAVFSNGKPTDLAKGLVVHVKGPVVQGVLKARTLSIDR
jgi:hypothetical protein